jgi:hypothetical protein
MIWEQFRKTPIVFQEMSGNGYGPHRKPYGVVGNVMKICKSLGWVQDWFGKVYFVKGYYRKRSGRDGTATGITCIFQELTRAIKGSVQESQNNRA